MCSAQCCAVFGDAPEADWRQPTTMVTSLMQKGMTIMSFVHEERVVVEFGR
jgi:hypothetical protein